MVPCALTLIPPAQHPAGEQHGAAELPSCPTLVFPSWWGWVSAWLNACVWATEPFLFCQGQPGSAVEAARAVPTAMVRTDVSPRNRLEEPLLQCLPEQSEHRAAGSAVDPCSLQS